MQSTYRPDCVSIAGAWGYIGRKFLDAALALGSKTYVHDPGKLPGDLAGKTFTRIADERMFYALPADFVHLALHPGQRQSGTDILLERAGDQRFLILNEKPMAEPDCPGLCPQITERVDRANAVMLYDFPELFDQMTQRICDYLAVFEHVEIHRMSFCRSKDREARDNPRNCKRMVPIQYQESVHCIAFALHVLGRLHGSLSPVLDRGLRVKAVSAPYDPPNPEVYPHVVDGRCEYTLTLGDVHITGKTDFKAGARWTKRRTLEGTADGRPFRIEAEYLEGEKWLVINGDKQDFRRTACSYQQAITTAWRWFTTLERTELMTGIYPNPQFARLTYQLSSLLWRSSHSRAEIELPSLEAALAYDARFANLRDQLPRYST